MDLGRGITLTPGLFHQITMDTSLHPDVDKDETWASLTLRYAF